MTRDNLVMLREAFAKAGRSAAEPDEIIGRFEARLLQLEVSEKATVDKQAA